MPSLRARLVIMRANLASVPPKASAMTTAASFADLVTMPKIASFALIFCPLRRPSLLGAMPSALRETFNL